MGGGSGGSIRAQHLDALERAAKNAIKEAAQPGRRSVFISFASEDLSEVNLLRGQAKNENSSVEFVDRSLREPFDSANREYIQRGIRERIRASSVTVVYVSSNAAQSQWVDWEIRESVRLGKGVVAVFKGDTPPSRVPIAIAELKVPMVPWRATRLMEAIEAAARDRA